MSLKQTRHFIHYLFVTTAALSPKVFFCLWGFLGSSHGIRCFLRSMLGILISSRKERSNNVRDIRVAQNCVLLRTNIPFFVLRSSRYMPTVGIDCLSPFFIANFLQLVGNWVSPFVSPLPDWGFSALLEVETEEDFVGAIFEWLHWRIGYEHRGEVVFLSSSTV